jgi:predicted transcriptional regulator
MAESTTAAENLRASRISFGISQSRLARLSRVSRFKICTYELGDGSLTLEEWDRIRRALQAEADRLRSIPAQIDFNHFDSAGAKAPLESESESATPLDSELRSDSAERP